MLTLHNIIINYIYAQPSCLEYFFSLRSALRSGVTINKGIVSVLELYTSNITTGNINV